MSTNKIEWEESDDYSSDTDKDENKNINEENKDENININENKYIEIEKNININIPSKEILEQQKSHTRACVTLTLDKTNTRLASGGNDGRINQYDLHSMTNDGESFKCIKQEDNVIVKQLQYSPINQLLLLISSSLRPQILNREGDVIGTCVAGYPYIMDQNQTKGHKGECTYGAWNPNQETQILTSSLDGSARIWDINTCTKKCQQIYKFRTKPGIMDSVGVTTCQYSYNGSRIAGGSIDGSIQIWDTNRQQYPIVTLPNIHKSSITNIQFVPQNDNLLLTRGDIFDNSIHVWDMRTIKTSIVNKPLYTFDAPCFGGSNTSNIVVHDTGNFFAYPCATQRNVDNSDGVAQGKDSVVQDKDAAVQDKEDTSVLGNRIEYRSLNDGKVIECIDLNDTTTADIIYMLWNTHSNEVYTSFSDGKIIGFFNPNDKCNLQRAKNIIGKSKKNNINFIDEVEAFEHSFVPGSEDDPTSKNYQHKKSIKHIVKKPPAYREAEYSQTSHLHYYLRDKVQKNQFDVSQDPREALLKYNQDDTSTYYLSAYKDTQPIPIFQTSSTISDDSDDNSYDVNEKRRRI